MLWVHGSRVVSPALITARNNTTQKEGCQASPAVERLNYQEKTRSKRELCDTWIPWCTSRPPQHFQPMIAHTRTESRIYTHNSQVQAVSISVKFYLSPIDNTSTNESIFFQLHLATTTSRGAREVQFKKKSTHLF